MQLTTMQQFDISAARYFAPSEILSLEEKLKANAKCGQTVAGTGGLMMRLRHPHVVRQSERGFYPVVVYFINEAENEIILIDVIDGMDEFEAMMKDPWTWAKAINVGRLLKALWDKVQ